MNKMQLSKDTQPLETDKSNLLSGLPRKLGRAPQDFFIPFSHLSYLKYYVKVCIFLPYEFSTKRAKSYYISKKK